MYNDTESLFLKIIVVGDPGVGKTSILTQYCYKRFEESTRPTIGCDFNTIIHHSKTNKVIKAQLWDIAGQEKFQAVSKLYVRGAQGCVIVCDVLDENSLKSTLKWKDLINNDPFFKEYKNGLDDPIPIILVQNKIDLIKPNKISEHMTIEYLENFSKENNFFTCFQTSAKTNQNLKEVFELLVEEILNRRITRLKQQINDLEEIRKCRSLSNTSESKKAAHNAKKCC